MARKVLFTASVYSHMANFHLPYLKWFQEQGWEVHIACAGIPKNVPEMVDQAIELPFQKRISAGENFRVARILRKYIRKEQYTLITTHTSLAAFFTRLALKGCPKRERPKLVNVVHGYLFDDDTPFLKRNLLLSAERFTASETDLLLTMNTWDDQLARKNHLAGQIEKIPGMGVDFSKLEGASREDGMALRKRYGIAEDAFVLIYGAEFSKRKSQEFFIRAMRQLPERVVLLLPGSGALQEACQVLTRKWGLMDRVIFPGQVSNMAVWYRASDAAVSASRSEGLPFHLMEAMYVGLPVVASAVKGHTDLIAEGVTGLLYPYGNIEAFQTQIDKLMQDRQFGITISDAGKVFIQQFALERVFPIVIDQYVGIVPTKNVARIASG